MAHIEVAKRHRWSWHVIAAVALLATAAIYWAVQRADNNDERSQVGAAAGADGPTAVGNETNAPVQDYLRFAGTAGTRVADVDQKFIVDGLRKLAGALGALNLGSPDLQVDLRVAAEHVLLNPASPATTEVVRNSLISAAGAIEPGRQKDGGDNLRRWAEAVHPNMPLLDQHVAVDEFFQQSGKAIKSLSGDPQ